ncbi:MAG: 4Fe-4S dicluster domain-containing protein [Chloroflexi bacterium]|nr:4Fe-4S dicluster domain-containing protein [Chloroflexota bacterium]
MEEQTMAAGGSNADRFGADWEKRASDLLRTAHYDSDLGKQVAKDALRLVGGELSEAEFFERHHGAYVKEFGTDKRPVISDERLEKALTESLQGGYVSRRTLLKMAGGGALGLLLGYWSWLGSRAAGTVAGAAQGGLPGVAGAEEEPPPVTTKQYGMVVDLERCDGCIGLGTFARCTQGCSAYNLTSPGVHWIYVFSFKDENQDAVQFLPRTCQHCSNPPCLKVCPVRARFKRPDDGIVLIDYNLCIGCRYCEVACPYGVNYFQWGEPGPEPGFPVKARDRWVEARPPRGVMGKCTFHPMWQDDKATSGRVICAAICPRQVLQFGDMNDPNSVPNQYLKKKREEKGGYISTFRLLEEWGTRPSNLYIGNQPSAKARPVTPPITYEDVGLVSKRSDVLQGPDSWLWFKNAFRGD